MASSRPLSEINFGKLIELIIEKVKKHAPNSSVRGNIEAIKARCNQGEFTQQTLHGEAALNRMIIRDTTVANYLTKETLIEIFRLHSKHQLVRVLTSAYPLYLYRDQSTTTISQALLRGFADGMDALKSLPSNAFAFTATDADEEKQLMAYEVVCVPLANKIISLAEDLKIDIATCYLPSEEKKLGTAPLSSSPTSDSPSVTPNPAKQSSALKILPPRTNEQHSNGQNTRPRASTSSAPSFITLPGHLAPLSPARRPTPLVFSSPSTPVASFTSSFLPFAASTSPIIFSKHLPSLSPPVSVPLTAPSTPSTSSAPSISPAPIMPSQKKEEDKKSQLDLIKDRISSRIVNHNFRLGWFGGTKLNIPGYNNKKVSAGAKDVMLLLNKAKEGDDIVKQVDSLLTPKMRSTCGFFCLGARDRSTVDLYEDILRICKNP